jgi:hypothetical protein
MAANNEAVKSRQRKEQVPGAGEHATSIHRASDRNCPKSLDRSRVEASGADETGPNALLCDALVPKAEASEATLDPFRTVSQREFSETHCFFVVAVEVVVPLLVQRE